MNMSLAQVARVLMAAFMAGVCLGAAALTVRAQSVEALQRSFVDPPDDAKIMMRWWWFGPAVTKPEIERELRVMKDAGIGGFEVQPVYPLSLDDPSKGIHNFPFLSDEFLDALKFTAEKARELGLRMDLTLGSGWPFGGPQVPVDMAAGGLRVERVDVAAGSRRVTIPSIGAGEKLLAVFLSRAEGKPSDADRFQELLEIREGAVWLPAGVAGTPEVQFYISSRTGMQVKRPAIGAEGFVLDHLDRAATDHYLNTVGERLLTAFGTKPPHAIFCDSLEVYGQDWTTDLLAAFRQRRGYELKPYLSALANDIGPKTADIRYDWGRTLSELYNERFIAPLQEWAKLHHTLLRIQNYGTPPATISSSQYANLPEGEGSQWKIVRASRWASSASHLYGRPVTSSETWTWLHSPVFRATPLDLKAEADRHFLQGINQLVGHGFPYSPSGAEYPGWRFYAAAAFGEKNPWWLVMPDISRYLQRISYLMRQGKPANDVALYLPNSDAWAHMKPGHTNMIETERDLVGEDLLPRILESGYNLDFFDDDALKQVGRVDQGALVLGGNRYRVVILPGVERIPLETITRLQEFVEGGGILIATRRTPQLAPGIGVSAAATAKVQAISRLLFANPAARAHFVADENRDLAATLVKAWRPDVALEPAAAELGFVHRTTAGAEIYFIANTANLPIETNATFRVSGLAPEWWDPLTGQVTDAAITGRPAGGTMIALHLEPYGSRVLVFSKRITSRPVYASTLANPPPFDLSRDWKVSFGAGGPVISMNELRSWTDSEATRYFSGLATYEKGFILPNGFVNGDGPVYLDLGEGTPIPAQELKAGMQTWLDAPVKEAAVVYVNGQRAGSLWCPPYRVEVTRFLHAGENEIRIEVGNLAVNYMAGRASPDYRLLNLRYGERFQAQDMDQVRPIAAGLFGPIRLVHLP